jgi:hypothetical protein
MDLFRRSTKPPPKEAARKGMFKSKTTENLETVRVKLAQVNEELARLEADTDKIALAAALDDNPSIGFAAISSLQEARARRDMLQRAEVAALANESARLNELRSRADKARSRARAQHQGEVERQTISVANDLVSLRNSFRKLVGAAIGIQKNLPSHLTGHIREGIEGALSEKNLRMIVDVAAYFGSRDGIAAPGCGERPRGLRFVENHY